MGELLVKQTYRGLATVNTIGLAAIEAAMSKPSKRTVEDTEPVTQTDLDRARAEARVKTQPELDRLQSQLVTVS